ncbi:FAD-binding protein [Arthrobacter sp. M4]|uniref:FAD-binding protein n=1 Tax=Arthrobacter sp. M4 TaxID=218160 RepID=UPI001CDCA883|nr:FAD-binding protein [Arthrobacter sp. M4]MCA4135625.1 FAD-binding protein [Arthrobacter sp. M4]
MQTVTHEQNWAGNLQYGAESISRPATIQEAQEVVASASKVRALGSRHSFNRIADTEHTLLSLENVDPEITIDEAASTVTVTGGVRYGTLAAELQANGFALHNLASLPHISIAGAVATATHGSGDRNGNLSTAVAGLEILDATGELRTLTKGDADFDGAVVSLGALGIVTRLTLEIEPTFEVRQDVYENLSWDAVLADYDAVSSSAYSVSLFTDWAGESVAQAWLKSRVADGQRLPASFFGGRPAVEPRHPLPGVSAVNCTEQLGVPGPWSDRLSHFRMAFMPSNGDELQSEYFVAREHAVEAIQAMRSLSAHISPLLYVSEIRTIAADNLWLSHNYGYDGVGLHLTWQPRQAEVEAVLPLIESTLAPFGARPHWAKLFHADAEGLRPLYPRFDDFKALAEAWDPNQKFRNAFLQQKVFGA